MRDQSQAKFILAFAHVGLLNKWAICTFRLLSNFESGRDLAAYFMLIQSNFS